MRPVPWWPALLVLACNTPYDGPLPTGEGAAIFGKVVDLFGLGLGQAEVCVLDTELPCVTTATDGEFLIEGLAEDGKLHALQRAFIDEDAMQCGYCCAGMIMNAAALLRELKQEMGALQKKLRWAVEKHGEDHPSVRELREHLHKLEREAKRRGVILPVHVEVETGMNRLSHQRF